MSGTKKALFLIGSPKAGGGTSGSLSAYLRARLEEQGLITETVRIKQSLASDKGVWALLTAAHDADVVILAFPLYVDCLPYPVIKTLELIAEDRVKNPVGKAQRFLAVLNCGFPEARQNDTALAICGRFVSETGMEWIGGLALGGGQAIDGLPLVKRGFLVRHVKKALDLAAEAITEGKALPEEAVRLMAKRLLPSWAYIRMGHAGWKGLAKKNGVLEKMLDRPYEIV